MAKLDGNKLLLNKEELALLGESRELELIPNKKGIFLLIDKHIDSNFTEEVLVEENTDQTQLLQKISEKKLTDLVEGKFENTLNKKEKELLKKLLEEKKVTIFKLNDSYKKGVYRVNEKTIVRKFDTEKFNTEKKPLPDYDLEKDGFIATSNLERARILSAEHKERIEEGELRGIKSFEGTYYLIQNYLLENYTKIFLNIFNEKEKISLIELAQISNISIELAKIICEFLKEDGELLEKKKGEYTYIK